MNNDEIAFSKVNIILGMFGEFFFIYIGADMFLNGDHYETNTHYNRYLIDVIFPLSCFFVLITIIPLISKLFSSEKGLVITGNGIIINAIAPNFGLIKWEDISKIDVKEIMSKKFIIIHIVDTNVYLERVKNPVFLFFLKRKINNYHYLISFFSIAFNKY